MDCYPTECHVETQPDMRIEAGYHVDEGGIIHPWFADLAAMSIREAFQMRPGTGRRRTGLWRAWRYRQELGVEESAKLLREQGALMMGEGGDTPALA